MSDVLSVKLLTLVIQDRYELLNLNSDPPTNLNFNWLRTLCIDLRQALLDRLIFVDLVASLVQQRIAF